MHIVIRAGGVGTRLWPYSRKRKPKQLFPLVSEKTMLGETIERAEKLTSLDKIYISLSKESEEAARGVCMGVRKDNMIVEPARRDTAAAVGLESLHVMLHDPNAIIVGFASDHVVMKQKEFKKIIEAAVAAVEKHPESIMAVGITPTSPHTGYGYIERGDEMDTANGEKVYNVRSFTEKPDAAKAEEFVSSGKYLWNANMFVWKASTIMQLFAQHQPKMFEHLEKIASAIGTEHYEQTLEREYGKIDKIAIEPAIIEKATSLLTMEADIGWNDIGDWASVGDVQAVGHDGNVVKGIHVGIDSTQSIIYGSPDKLIATVGLEDMIVIDTEDVLLIAPKSRAQDIKKLVDEVEKAHDDKYL